MSTKNLILGAAATCLAVGSAFASYLSLSTIIVKLPGGATGVTVQTSPTCSGTTKCLIKVVTRNGVHTVAASATILTSGGINAVLGSGLVSTIARTKP